MDKSHLPNIQDPEGLVGLTLLCVILELSIVLHPGTYDDESPMTERERIILIEARKHAREIMRWMKISFNISEDNIQVEMNFFENFLWQVAMTLAAAVEENQKRLSSFLETCTPDKVAGALYDSLVNGRYGQNTAAWMGRAEYVRTTYDWDGGKLSILPKDDNFFPPEEELGLTESDICYFDNQPTPSVDIGVTMAFWMKDESDKPAGK